jgi:hypothetical protein
LSADFPHGNWRDTVVPDTGVAKVRSSKDRTEAELFGLAGGTIASAAADEPSGFSKLAASRNASTSFSSCCNSASFSRSKSLIFYRVAACLGHTAHYKPLSMFARIGEGVKMANLIPGRPRKLHSPGKI